jgi:hypothetical protein
MSKRSLFSKFISLKLKLAVVLVTFGLSCTKQNAQTPQTPLEELNAQRAKWEALEIDKYSLSQQMSCFCIYEVTEKFQVTINNNSIISVDSAPPDTQWHAHLMTVDDTFNRVLYLIKQDPVRLTIEYDSTYGFISYFFYDLSEMIADEEQSFTFTDFQVLSQ